MCDYSIVGEVCFVDGIWLRKWRVEKVEKAILNIFNSDKTPKSALTIIMNWVSYYLYMGFDLFLVNRTNYNGNY
jgi:hypothetical protein